MTQPQPQAEPPESVYRQREEIFAAEEARWSERSRLFSAARLVVFLGFVGCLVMSLVAAAGMPVGWIVGAVGAFALFAVLALLHDRVIRQERRFAELAAINRRSLARLARDWPALLDPPPPPSPDAADLPLAKDLHLFGRRSLLHLLADALTPPGARTLGGWLLSPAAPESVRARQAAVAELAEELPFRQELTRRAAHLSGADSDVGPFLAWAEGEPWLLPRRGRRIISFATPALVLAAIAAAVAGWVPGSLPFLLFLANIGLTHLLGGEAVAIFDRVALREGRFLHYAELLEHLDGARFESPRLAALWADLRRSGLSAHRQMERLHGLVVLSDTRHSGLVHFFVQGLFLWDFHVLARLERWQVTAGREARRWIEVLAEVEALAALAGLAWDEPEWVYPEIVENGPAVFEAEALGHPLLPGGARVANDVTLGPPGTFLLVTGSNMSGKSTLLRAVGVNAVLAGAGGPVCARELRLPPLVLGTSILIEDSLDSGISFFMAELLRLREIVESARRSRGEGRTLLYLLDEVLRGTNSRERRMAAREILSHLLEAEAIGAVSTHDAALLESPELSERSHPVHFTETLTPGAAGRQVMTFDYHLRPGVATGGNAMKLLELVGLTGRGEPSDEEVGDEIRQPG